MRSAAQTAGDAVREAELRARIADLTAERNAL